MYDPATGHFSLVGSLPPIDRAEIAADGVGVPTGDPYAISVGTLVALADGGALVIGRSDEWKHEGWVTRNFRFDAPSGRWRQVGKANAGVNDWETGALRLDARGRPGGRLAAALPNGSVLVAGGAPAARPGEVSSRARIEHAPRVARARPLPRCHDDRVGVFPRTASVLGGDPHAARRRDVWLVGIAGSRTYVAGDLPLASGPIPFDRIRGLIG